MPNQDRIGGIVEVIVDGESLEITSDAWQWNLGEPKREGVVGGNGRPVGYTETPVLPMLKGKVHVTSRTKLRELLRKGSATCILKLPWGQSFVLREAWTQSEGEVDTAKSEMTLEFAGRSADLV